jgi:hypothetical protein
MDHEYSISGKLWIGSLHIALPQEYLFSDSLFVIGTDGSIAPKDPRTAEGFSERDLRTLCCQLSQEFGTRVRMEKLHEEYGVANVFNGGSDYEVVSADRFTCEYECGKEVCCEKRRF